MASTARWKITQAPSLVERAKFKDILHELMAQLGSSGKTWWFCRFEVTQEAPDAIALIEESVTNAWAAADTADIHVESSSADDDVGGAGCEYVHIVYIDSSNAIQDLKQPMDGTAHSHLNVGTVKQFIGMYVDSTETIDPVGNITLKNHAETEVYQTIVAGDWYSITTKMWIPDGYKGAVISLVPKFEIANGANPVFANGTNIAIDVNGVEKCRTGITPENIGRELANPQPFGLESDGESYLGVMHETMDTDANLTETIDVVYLIWEA